MRNTEFLTRRIGRLADTLSTLKDRVRAAVAAELGQAVGQAVQDVLGEFVRGAVVDEPPPRAVDRNAWDDDDEDDDPPRPVAMPNSPEPPEVTDRWQHALAIGAGLARWWLARGGPAWVGGLVGLAAAIAAAYGGPLWQAGVRVLVLAAELAAHRPLHIPL